MGSSFGLSRLETHTAEVGQGERSFFVKCGETPLSIASAMKFRKLALTNIIEMAKLDAGKFCFQIRDHPQIIAFLETKFLSRFIQ